MESRAAILDRSGVLDVSNAKFAMWLFLGSEVMFFAGLIGAYMVLRVAHPEMWNAREVLDIQLTALNTFILICSSVTMVRAFGAIVRGDQDGMRRGLLLTAILGQVFLSIQAYEWTHLIVHGLRPSSILGACFFTLTGFHGMHVFGGVILVLTVLYRALPQGGFTKERHEGVELAGLYWHFVDLVWIILFTILYLI